MIAENSLTIKITFMAFLLASVEKKTSKTYEGTCVAFLVSAAQMHKVQVRICYTAHASIMKKNNTM